MWWGSLWAICNQWHRTKFAGKENSPIRATLYNLGYVSSYTMDSCTKLYCIHAPATLIVCWNTSLFERWVSMMWLSLYSWSRCLPSSGNSSWIIHDHNLMFLLSYVWREIFKGFNFHRQEIFAILQVYYLQMWAFTGSNFLWLADWLST